MLRFLVLPLTLIAVLLLQPPVDSITLQAAHCRDCKLTALSPSSSCKVQNSACFHQQIVESPAIDCNPVKAL